MNSLTHLSKLNVKCRNPCGFHNMVVHQWGDPDNSSVVICLHGLTRAAKDFLCLANELKIKYRVLAPDLAGRGESDWLANESLYQISQYINDLNSMFIQLDLKKINVIGTSFGGLIGLLMASSIFNSEYKNSPFFFGVSNTRVDEKIIFESLVINDFGSQVQLSNLFNLANQIDFEPDIELEDFNEAVLLVKRICKDFGHHSSSQWKVLTESFFRQEKENGPFKIHFDPAIVSHFRRFFSVLGGNLKTNLIRIPDLNFWTFYDNLNCKTLLLRGMESSLLDRDTAIQMTKRGPKPKLVEFAGIGHAPTLMQIDQIAIIKNFLNF
ncbi:MAG: hypothetical protein CBC01_06590 [Betaproteobacteria bacterium TMED41]|nr:MAG: hypothetical protein CBC01_06590 [Betaproteobacteria bacterium TMED41]|tara:strand:- start:387 stop:1358 length:972 start_codon:yes stop_codon:yes gene_type:complete